MKEYDSITEATIVKRKSIGLECKLNTRQSSTKISRKHNLYSESHNEKSI